MYARVRGCVCVCSGRPLVGNANQSKEVDARARARVRKRESRHVTGASAGKGERERERKRRFLPFFPLAHPLSVPLCTFNFAPFLFASAEVEAGGKGSLRDE